MDLHEDIHRAIENYLDPNEFRRFLNSAIQNSRGVTFLLQKRKARWANFDVWYGAWQESAKTNPVLTWGVTARNRVVKEEDLNTLSTAKITLYAEGAWRKEDVWSVSPETPIELFLYAFAKVREERPAPRQGRYTSSAGGLTTTCLIMSCPPRSARCTALLPWS